MGRLDDHNDDGRNVFLQLQRCHHSSREVQGEIVKLARRGGRSIDCKIWSRRDLLASSYKTTCKGGPEWAQVFGRITVEDQSGHVVESRLRSEIPRSLEHGRLESGKSNVTTYLLYVDDRFESHH